MMTRTFGWGILGTGAIARKFAADLHKLPQARLLAVGSRSADKAATFAQENGFERAYGSYAELMRDPDVDVIYVATPHPLHHENTIACLAHGKAVLCEKPLAMNERQAREMVACARANGVFLMEAMWTRFLPVIRQVQEWLAARRIGDVRALWANFGFVAPWRPEWRLLNPELGGGALLDVGVYVVSFAYMVFGRAPAEVHAAALIGETGVDEQTGMLLQYDRGEFALLACAIRTPMVHAARISGSAGAVDIPLFWRATQATLEVTGEEPVSVTGENGYHFEAAEVMSCLEAGTKESPLMPLDESVAIAHSLDRVRSIIGLRYPMEA